MIVGGTGTIGPSSVPGSRSQNAHACCGSAWTIGIGSRSHTGSFPDQRPCQCAQVQHPPLVVSGRGVLWSGFMAVDCIKIQYIAAAPATIFRILGPESPPADPKGRAPGNPASCLPARSASPRRRYRAEWQIFPTRRLERKRPASLRALMILEAQAGIEPTYTDLQSAA